MEEGTQEPQVTLGGTEQETPQAPLTETDVAEAAGEFAAYVVQMHQPNTIDAWRDIATVTVPPRTRRKSVLEKALDEAGGEYWPAVDEPREYRVLDAQSFEAIPAAMEPPEPSDPVLRIGR